MTGKIFFAGNTDTLNLNLNISDFNWRALWLRIFKIFYTMLIFC